MIDIAVVRFPRISNFTDFNVFECIDGVSVRYVNNVSEIGNPDMIILPGSKNTVADLLWMRENGIEAAVKKVNALFSVYVAVIKCLVKNHRYRQCGKRRKCSRYGTFADENGV